MPFPASIASENMSTMPQNATAIATHVRTRHALAQEHTACDRRQERRDAHQHEGVGDRRSCQRGDEKEKRSREKET